MPQKVLATKYWCILLQVVDLSQFVHYFGIYFMSLLRYRWQRLDTLCTQFMMYELRRIWEEAVVVCVKVLTLRGKILVLAAVLRIAISESGFVLVISWLSVTTNCSHLNFLIVEIYTYFCSSKVHLVLQSISFVAHQSMAALSFKSLTIIFSTECERKSTWTVIVWWTVTAIQWWLWTMWGRIATLIPKTTKGCH